MPMLDHSRQLIAGAFAFLLLAPFSLALAQPDDGDDEEIVEEPISAERGFQMLGGDREGTAWSALEGQDRSALVERAMETVRTSNDSKAVVGAAVFLGDPRVRDSVAGDQAKPVRDRLSKAGADSELRGALIEALGAVGKPQDLWELKRMVREGKTSEVTPASRALCRSSDGDALGSLLFSADSLDDPERLAAVQTALTWMAGSERGGELVEAIGATESPQILEVLTRVRSAEGAASVRLIARDRLESDDPDVRAVAVRLLVSSRDTKSTELVVEALSDDDPSVRAAAATAARQLTMEEAVPKLIELLSDERVAQEAAHSALIALTGMQLPRDQRRWQLWLDKQRKKGATERNTIADEEHTAAERDREALAERVASEDRLDPKWVVGGAAVALVLLFVAAIRVLRDQPAPVKLVEVSATDAGKSRSRRKQRKGTTAWTQRFRAKELQASIDTAKADGEIEELVAPSDEQAEGKAEKGGASAWTKRLKRMVEGGGLVMHGYVEEGNEQASPLPKQQKPTTGRMLKSLLTDEWGREE